MPIATRADVEVQLGRTVTDAELGRLPALLSNAEDAVKGYTRHDDDWLAPVGYPDAVVRIVAKMVARTIDSRAAAPLNAEQLAAGPFSTKFAAGTTNGDVWLTKADKMALRNYRTGGGVTSVRLLSERYVVSPDGTVTDDPDDDF